MIPMEDFRDAYTVDRDGHRVPMGADTRRDAMNGVHLHFAAQAGEACDWCRTIQGDEPEG